MIDLAVIMSIYAQDRLPFVRESVESILDQTYSNFHYYLIFDGQVSDEVEQYITALKDDRVRLFRLEINRGLAVALNTLLEVVLKNTEYRYIARMDADDVSMLQRFELQRKFLQDNTHVTLVGSWYMVIDESGKEISGIVKLPLDHESLRKRYFLRSPFAHSSVMFHRRLTEIAGMYPTTTILMEDNILWGNALKKGLKFANIPENLLKFRRDKNFYNRRSGIKYGWNYIKYKTRINRSLGSPLSLTLIVIFSGCFKMLPSFFSRLLYFIR